MSLSKRCYACRLYCMGMTPTFPQDVRLEQTVKEPAAIEMHSLLHGSKRSIASGNVNAMIDYRFWIVFASTLTKTIRIMCKLVQKHRLLISHSHTQQRVAICRVKGSTACRSMMFTFGASTHPLDNAETCRNQASSEIFPSASLMRPKDPRAGAPSH